MRKKISGVACSAALTSALNALAVLEIECTVTTPTAQISLRRSSAQFDRTSRFVSLRIGFSFPFK